MLRRSFDWSKGKVSHGLRFPALPTTSWSTLVALAPAALTIALLSFMEAISSGLAVAGPDERPEADRELVALGLSNLATGFLRGRPIDGPASADPSLTPEAMRARFRRAAAAIEARLVELDAP